MASRDINVNVNVTFLEDGVKIKMIRKLTRSDMADKMNGKGSCFLSTFIRNANDRYSEEKKNIESICPKKELYHVDLSKPIGIIIDGYLYGFEIDEKED